MNRGHNIALLCTDPGLIQCSCGWEGSLPQTVPGVMTEYLVDEWLEHVEQVGKV